MLLQDKRVIIFQRRGAMFALNYIAKLFGADLLNNLPSLWEYIKTIGKHKDVIKLEIGKLYQVDGDRCGEGGYI